MHRIPSIFFIGRKQELLYIINTVSSTEIPSRDILFIYGPRGIGKTRLSIEAAIKLTKHGMQAIYISMEASGEEPYSILENTAIQIDEALAKLSRVKGSRSAEGITDKSFRRYILDLLDQRNYSLLDIFYRLLERTSKTVAKQGGGAVFLDEPWEALSKLGEWSPGRLYRFIARLQEYVGKGSLRIIFVSGDPFIRWRFVEEVPSEYITTLYLGEMTRLDTEEMIRTLASYLDTPLRIEVEENIDNIADIIGGHPDKILLFFSKIARYRSIGRALSVIASSLIEDLLVKLESIRSRVKGGSNYYEFAKNILLELTRSPIKLTAVASYEDGMRSIIEDLVRHGILQYGNSRYIGIYTWNEKESGGEGPLDYLAPASRLHFYALCEAMGSEDDNCNRLREIYKSII